MTLVEVVAALAMLGTLLVAVLLARAGYVRQAAAADRRLQAVAAADALLAAWHRDPASLPRSGSGMVAGDGQFSWRTRAVANPDAAALGADTLRLEVLDDRAAGAVLVGVEFVADPPRRGRAPPAPAADGGKNVERAGRGGRGGGAAPSRPPRARQPAPPK
jgi:hypothetical protein